MILSGMHRPYPPHDARALVSARLLFIFHFVSDSAKNNKNVRFVFLCRSRSPRILSPAVQRFLRTYLVFVSVCILNDTYYPINKFLPHIISVSCANRYYTDAAVAAAAVIVGVLVTVIIAVYRRRCCCCASIFFGEQWIRTTGNRGTGWRERDRTSPNVTVNECEWDIKYIELYAFVSMLECM